MILLLLACTTWQGCHLIFTYEDTPPDAAPAKDHAPPAREQFVSRLDLKIPKDRQGPIIKDREVPRDLGNPPDIKPKQDKNSWPDQKQKPDLKLKPDQQQVVDLKPTAPKWTWIATGNTKDLYDVWGSASHGFRAVGDDGVTVRYFNKKWSVSATHVSYDFRAVWGVGGWFYDMGYRAINNGGSLALKTTSATHFKHITNSPGDYFVGAHGRATSAVYAVGSKSLFYKIDGITWAPISYTTSLGNPNLNDVHIDASGNILAVGDKGVVLRFAGSVLKSAKKLPGLPDLTGVWDGEGVNMYITGENGTIYTYSTADDTVGELLKKPSIQWTDIRGNSKGLVYAVGVNGLDGYIVSFLKGKLDSGRYVYGTSTSPRKLKAVWVADDGQVVIVGKTGLVYHLGL